MAYPVFLKLEGRLCIVVGAGQVAERRVRRLVDAGARVCVVGLEATEGLQRLACGGKIQLVQRAFSESDLDSGFLAIAATDDRDVNQTVQAAAAARDILFCGADQHTDSDFIVPAVIQRSDLQLAISTNGYSPAYAKLLRTELENWLEEGHTGLLELLADLRPRVFAQFPDAPERRKAFWRQIVTPEILALARKGQWDDIEEQIALCLLS